jgi:hypothetical protein
MLHGASGPAPGPAWTCSGTRKRSPALPPRTRPPTSGPARIASGTQVALSGGMGHRIYERKTCMTWSPLTESNRRPSPYHGAGPRRMTASTGLEFGGTELASSFMWELPTTEPPPGSQPRWATAVGTSRRDHRGGDHYRLTERIPRQDAAAALGPRPVRARPGFIGALGVPSFTLRKSRSITSAPSCRTGRSSWR